MLKTVINSVVHTGEDLMYNVNVHVENGIIRAIDSDLSDGTEIIDLKGKNISAGLIDIQINGGFTKYFARTPDKETLDDIKAACLQYGTPYFLPTLITSPIDEIMHVLDVVADYKREYEGLIGLHLEGPYLNPEKKGLHDAKFIKKADDDELAAIIKKGKGIIKIMTVAPEMLTEKQLQMLIDSGIVVSIGHTTIGYDEACRYFKMGVKLVTHLYNAMTQMGHRECGMVGAVFDNDNVYAPIILDGGHLHYAAARVAYRQKRDKLILLTDSSFLGRQMPQYNWDRLTIKMQDGYYRNAEGTLAGAAISMVEAVQNARGHLHISLQEAVQMATSRVAKAIGEENNIGFIKPGYPAKFFVFDDDLNGTQTLTL